MTGDPLDSLRDATAGLRGQAAGALEGLTQVRPFPSPPPSTPRLLGAGTQPSLGLDREQEGGDGGGVGREDLDGGLDDPSVLLETPAREKPVPPMRLPVGVG